MKILRDSRFWWKGALLGIFLAVLWIAAPAGEPRTGPKAIPRPPVTASPDVIAMRRVHLHRATRDYPALLADLQAIADFQSPLLPSQLSTFNLQLSTPDERLANLYREIALLYAATDPAAAPEAIQRAIELDPGLKARLRPLERAIRRAEDADDPAYLLTLSGRELAALGEWELAEAAFERAVAANPAYAEAWAYLGEARQHSRSGNDPLEALETARTLDPQSVAAHSFLSLYWQRQNDLETALAHAQAAADLAPDTPELLMRLGDLTALNGDLAAGQDLYLRAVATAPDDPDTLRALIAFNIRYGFDLRETALPLARHLAIANPRDPASLDVMGEVLLRLGDLSNAERFFRRALAQDPDFALAHLHLGDLYRLQGKPQQAYDHYQRVLELNASEAVRSRAQEALKTLHGE